MRIFIILMVLFSINAYAKPVNINTADANTISESLKGIGQKKAEEIVRYRTEIGTFETLNDLINVKGVGQKTIDKNADDILFSNAAASTKSPNKEKKENKSK